MWELQLKNKIKASQFQHESPKANRRRYRQSFIFTLDNPMSKSNSSATSNETTSMSPPEMLEKSSRTPSSTATAEGNGGHKALQHVKGEGAATPATTPPQNETVALHVSPRSASLDEEEQLPVKAGTSRSVAITGQGKGRPLLTRNQISFILPSKPAQRDEVLPEELLGIQSKQEKHRKQTTGRKRWRGGKSSKKDVVDNQQSKDVGSSKAKSTRWKSDEVSTETKRTSSVKHKPVRRKSSIDATHTPPDYKHSSHYLLHTPTPNKKSAALDIAVAADHKRQDSESTGSEQNVKGASLPKVGTVPTSPSLIPPDSFFTRSSSSTSSSTSSSSSSSSSKRDRRLSETRGDSQSSSSIHEVGRGSAAASSQNNPQQEIGPAKFPPNRESTFPRRRPKKPYDRPTSERSWGPSSRGGNQRLSFQQAVELGARAFRNSLLNRSLTRSASVPNHIDVMWKSEDTDQTISGEAMPANESEPNLLIHLSNVTKVHHKKRVIPLATKNKGTTMRTQAKQVHWKGEDGLAEHRTKHSDEEEDDGESSNASVTFSPSTGRLTRSSGKGSLLSIGSLDSSGTIPIRRVDSSGTIRHLESELGIHLSSLRHVESEIVMFELNSPVLSPDKGMSPHLTSSMSFSASGDLLHDSEESLEYFKPIASSQPEWNFTVSSKRPLESSLLLSPPTPELTLPKHFAVQVPSGETTYLTNTPTSTGSRPVSPYGSVTDLTGNSPGYSTAPLTGNSPSYSTAPSRDRSFHNDAGGTGQKKSERKTERKGDTAGLLAGGFQDVSGGPVSPFKKLLVGATGASPDRPGQRTRGKKVGQKQPGKTRRRPRSTMSRRHAEELGAYLENEEREISGEVSDEDAEGGQNLLMDAAFLFYSFHDVEVFPQLLSAFYQYESPLCETHGALCPNTPELLGPPLLSRGTLDLSPTAAELRTLPNRNSAVSRSQIYPTKRISTENTNMQSSADNVLSKFSTGLPWTYEDLAMARERAERDHNENASPRRRSWSLGKDDGHNAPLPSRASHYSRTMSSPSHRETNWEVKDRLIASPIYGPVAPPQQPQFDSEAKATRTVLTFSERLQALSRRHSQRGDGGPASAAKGSRSLHLKHHPRHSNFDRASSETKDTVVLVPETVAFQRAVTVLDSVPHKETFKIGLVYFGRNQRCVERNILSNQSGSPEFEAFLAQMGEKVQLKGYEKYMGGLDRTSNLDGKYTIVWEDSVTEVCFLVSTLMPQRAEDPDCNHKKRHIGNAAVLIVFSESDIEAFKPSAMAGYQNLVYIVCRPLDAKYCRIRVICRESAGFARPPPDAMLDAVMNLPPASVSAVSAGPAGANAVFPASLPAAAPARPGSGLPPEDLAFSLGSRTSSHRELFPSPERQAAHSSQQAFSQLHHTPEPARVQPSTETQQPLPSPPFAAQFFPSLAGQVLPAFGPLAPNSYHIVPLEDAAWLVLQTSIQASRACQEAMGQQTVGGPPAALDFQTNWQRRLDQLQLIKRMASSYSRGDGQTVS